MGNFELGEKGLVLVVSDGMGGALAGDVASRMAIEAVRDVLTGNNANGPECNPEDSLVDCLKHADQDLDAALRWTDSEYPYTKLGLLSGPFSEGPEGCTRAMVHVECRDGDTQVDLAFRTRPDSANSIVREYYGLSRRMRTQPGGPQAAPRDDMHWLAGRDTCMAVRDQAGHFVALLVVAAYGYDSTQDTLWFGSEDPQQSIQDNLGNIVKAAQACWNGH